MEKYHADFKSAKTELKYLGHLSTTLRVTGKKYQAEGVECRSHAELVSASALKKPQTLKQVQGDDVLSS
jgi:hypothetical protein